MRGEWKILVHQASSPLKGIRILLHLHLHEPGDGSLTRHMRRCLPHLLPGEVLIMCAKGWLVHIIIIPLLQGQPKSTVPHQLMCAHCRDIWGELTVLLLLLGEGMQEHQSCVPHILHSPAASAEGKRGKKAAKERVGSQEAGVIDWWDIEGPLLVLSLILSENVQHYKSNVRGRFFPGFLVIFYFLLFPRNQHISPWTTIFTPELQWGGHNLLNSREVNCSALQKQCAWSCFLRLFPVSFGSAEPHVLNLNQLMYMRENNW